jgi:hypothetical protein
MTGICTDRSAGIGGAWKVKPLEWREPSQATNGCWTAESPLGTYSIVNEGGQWFACRDEAPRDFYFEWAATDLIRDTQTVARAACQADLQARILSALSPAMLDWLAFNDPFFTDRPPYCNTVRHITKADAVAYWKRTHEGYAGDDEQALLEFMTVMWAWSALSPAMLDKEWKVVPVEPTKEMCEAAPALPAIHAVDDLPLAEAGWSPKAIINRKRYRAMLSAAPSISGEPKAKWCEACGTVTTNKECDCTTFPETAHLQKLVEPPARETDEPVAWQRRLKQENGEWSEWIDASKPKRINHAAEQYRALFTRPQSPKSPDALVDFVRRHASDKRLTDAEFGSLVRHHPLATLSGEGEG